MRKSLTAFGGGFEPMDSTPEPPPTYFSSVQSSHITPSTPCTFAPTNTTVNLSPDECSSGFQSTSASAFTSCLPSSSSTTINEYPPVQPQLTPEQVIGEIQRVIANENDKVVLGSAFACLFSYSINSIHGPEACHLVSASPVILNALYKLLTDEQFKEDDPLLFVATGNLTNISKYESGRSAILGCDGLQDEWPSRGVRSLMSSLQSRESSVVIVAITAVHNLLLDRRMEVQDIAKKQIKLADGIKHVVAQLDNRNLANNYEFKVIVLDCLQILAYGNPENRLAILDCGGSRLLLATIQENLDKQSTEDLVETASRVLKSLSVCPGNKIDIIGHNGIEILTRCIRLDNQEILKTCLWTLRNLSDVINNTDSKHGIHINQLVERLLEILNHYSEEPCIVTCALGVLANLTCNNEPIKQLICNYNGVELLLAAIETAQRDSRDFQIRNNEILEPAVCALCHLMNQPSYPRLELERQRVYERFIHDQAFKTLRWAPPTDDLARAVEKLISLLGDNKVNLF